MNLCLTEPSSLQPRMWRGVEMSNLIHNFQRWVESAFAPGRVAPKVEMRKQYAIRPPPPHVLRKSTLVKRTPRPYWDEHGWRREGGKYSGLYQTRFGNWAGYATVSPSGRVEVFIQHPPAVLEQHPHWQCFNKRHNGWYFVHSTSPISDVSAGIINVEKTITEAYEN